LRRKIKLKKYLGKEKKLINLNKITIKIKGKFEVFIDILASTFN
jgi:hypothetical protein